MPRIRNAVLFAALLAVPCGSAAADTLPNPPPFDPEKALAASRIADPEAATQAYLESIPAERRTRTKAYAQGNYILDVVDFGVSSLILVGLLAFGVSAGMRDRAQSWTRLRPLQTAAYWVQFTLLLTVVLFPLTLYRSYHREKAYGLLTQGFGDWLADQAKGLALGCVLGSLLLMLLYGVLRRTPRSWWLWGSAVVVAFLIVSLAIGPVFIAPIFNTFTPVKDPAIRDSILAMARSQGVPADDVYEMDASRRTDRISAYVSGMLGTTRIVLFDTTMKRCTPDEIRMIMGHEMGHYVLNHVWKFIGFFAVLIVLGFLCVRWGFARAVSRWPGVGVAGVADVAGFPLLWLLLSAFFFVAGPVVNTYSRAVEAEADDFAFMVGQDPDADATTNLKLGEYRDLDPHPLIELLFYDHPAGKRRIRTAMDWKKAHPR